MKTRSWLSGVSGAALLIGTVSTVLASAQPSSDTAAPSSAGATLLRGGVMGELLLVYVPRDEAEIRRLLEVAKNLQNAAASEVDASRRLASETDGRAKVMEKELEATEARIELAKRANERAARAELEATLRRQTREVQYLQRLREALRADSDQLEAERAAAVSWVKALELELEVARRHGEFASRPPATEALAQYRSLLREMLVAQAHSADQWREAWDKRKRVADQRLNVLESLSKLSK